MAPQDRRVKNEAWTAWKLFLIDSPLLEQGKTAAAAAASLHIISDGILKSAVKKKKKWGEEKTIWY